MKVLYSGGPQRQEGAVLVLSLVFLLIFTIMGLNSMDTAVLESRMASSIRQHQSILMLAEFTLRKIEHGVMNYNVIHGTVTCSDRDHHGLELAVCFLVEQLQGVNQGDGAVVDQFLVSVKVAEKGTGNGTLLRSVLDISCEADQCLHSRNSWQQGSPAEMDLVP